MSQRSVQCAIYTRKSSEEGLDQEFNSLDAQRVACSAYISSQAGEGWKELSASYDDGGISGGTIERPGLQCLLEDVRAGRVKIVVVYKVDRLTRSLSDFAKIIDVLEEHDASFVSVTQQFSTTTSIGRLTLNMLLSFAQFEREVTAERIRDKIAASKKKGIWMGGVVPLGYDVVDRHLIINKTEAETVRTLFELYREHGNARIVEKRARELNLRTKPRLYRDGRKFGNESFTRGHIYKLLVNRLYIGEITHKGTSYPGAQDAIIDQELWDAVQKQLAQNAVNRTTSANAKAPSLLTGLLSTEEGHRFSPSHANKSGRRYRYYVSQPPENDNAPAWRLPAPVLEKVVLDTIKNFLSNPSQLTTNLGHGLGADQLRALFGHAGELSLGIEDALPSMQRRILNETVAGITIYDNRISIRINTKGLRRLFGLQDNGQSEDFEIELQVSFRRRGIETRLVIGSDNHSRQPDEKLVELVVQAHRWFGELKNGTASSVHEIAVRDQVDPGDVSRILPLAFLAPDIVKGILDGEQPTELTSARLKRMRDLPQDWAQQRRYLGFEVASQTT